jgi:membrane associated rhomboid family serine protease
LPVVTLVATAVAAAAAVAQYTLPAMTPALQRGNVLPAPGQWWRLVTPLLVQTLGWYQVVANLVTLVIIGAITECLLGRWLWLALFCAGTLGGQAAAFAWHQPGGGDSIAICGLAGGVAVALLARPSPGTWPAAQAVVLYVAALTGWGFSGARAAALACVSAWALLYGLRKAGLAGVERLALTGTVVCALALATAREDLHGASLLSGMALMALLLAGARASQPAGAGPAR